jgi:hypothetical protein
MHWLVPAAGVLVLMATAPCGRADLASFDCQLKQLGLDYAQSLQPFRSTAELQVSVVQPANLKAHCTRLQVRLVRRRCVGALCECVVQIVADALNNAAHAGKPCNVSLSRTRPTSSEREQVA